MSDTPRTDAEFKLEAFFDGAGIVETVLVEFAEQLETELADKDKRLAEITRQRNAYKKALEIAEDELMTARADAEHWKSECNALQRMVHEARAEIERLKKQNLDRASATLWAIMRHAFMDGAFKGYQHGTEERLRIQYFNEWCQKNYPEAVDEAITQMRLIEQMGEALKLADDLIDEYAADYEHRDNVDEIREEIKAALAAERGE